MAASPSVKAPLAILRSSQSVYDCSFLTEDSLVSGTTVGDLQVWSLADHRVAASWSVCLTGLLAVAPLGGSQACLCHGKDGSLKLWDLNTGQVFWQVVAGGACHSFARCTLMPTQAGDPLDEAPAACVACAPHNEGLGLFDCRDGSCKNQLVLEDSRPAGHDAKSHSLGMCMAICRMPALGSHYLLAVHESTETCIWDVRAPKEPAMGPTLAGKPQSPAISAAVVWRTAWVASSDGAIHMVRAKTSGCLEVLPQTAQADESAHHKAQGMEGLGGSWQPDKLGINSLAVRQDLRLVVAARWDKRIELFDAKTARSLGRLQCHDSGVLCVCFDRKRGLFATGGEDGRIAVWDALAETYQGPHTIDATIKAPAQG